MIKKMRVQSARFFEVGCWMMLSLIVFPRTVAEALASNNAEIMNLSSIAKNKPIIDFQYPHEKKTPAELMTSISKSTSELLKESDDMDVYGDFEATIDESYLRRFEREISQKFGKEDAVFMPSGTMAQSIALKIHKSAKEKKHGYGSGSVFACHHTSHLLLWEEDAYSHLLGMDATVVSSSVQTEQSESYVYSDPMKFRDVKRVLDVHDVDEISTLLIELPHRELGGKLTKWEEVLAMSTLCEDRGISFHCDGARIFEASAGYGLPLHKVAEPFDSVYISFYKGIGAMTGAMLMGSAEFCAEARIWLCRFGGNLYSKLPYAISCWGNYLDQVENVKDGLTFQEKHAKMQKIVEALSCNEKISKYVSFQPKIPETSMVHCFLKANVDQCKQANDEISQRFGVKIFSRIREVEGNSNGVGAYFEWSIGQANGKITEEAFVDGWTKFVDALESSNS